MRELNDGGLDSSDFQITSPQEQQEISEDASYLTIKQAAELSGYDPNYIWRLAHTEQIRSRVEVVEITVKKQKILINKDDLLRWKDKARGPYLEDDNLEE